MNCPQCGMPLDKHTQIRMQLCYQYQRTEENIANINRKRIDQYNRFKRRLEQVAQQKQKSEDKQL